MNNRLEVKCSLCGGDCWYDSRDEWKIIGALTVWLGLFLLPIGSLMLLGWWTGWDESVRILVGFILWAVLTALFFSRHARWVCSQCGSWFPALRTRPKTEDDTRGQPPSAGDVAPRAAPEK